MISIRTSIVALVSVMLLAVGALAQSTVLYKAGQEPAPVCVTPGKPTPITIFDWNAYRGAPIEYVIEVTWEPEIGRPATKGTIEGQQFIVDADMMTMRRQWSLKNCRDIIKPHTKACAFTVTVMLTEADVTGLLGFRAHTKDHQFRGKVRVTTLPPPEDLLEDFP